MTSNGKHQDPPGTELSSDQPITNPDQDQFQRSKIAIRVAKEALTAPSDEGFVIGICGPWGAGKSSVGNLAARKLEEDPRCLEVVRFNPWFFTGANELLQHFFAELSHALGRGDGKLRAVAGKLQKYAGVVSGPANLIPVAGSTVSQIIQTGANTAGLVSEAPSLRQTRAELQRALLDVEGRIVVFIDDLDRLTSAEIREVIRTVKLVGDLPRVSYVLLYDQDPVEEALGDGERGRKFMEKIIQSRFDVPPARTADLRDLLRNELARLLPNADIPDSHTEDWLTLLHFGISSFLQVPRDSKRLANAIPAAVEIIGDEVALVDLIGLEALRVFQRDVHRRLVGVSHLLTPDALTEMTAQASEESKQELDDVLACGDPKAAKGLLARLFPRSAVDLGPSRTVEDRQIDRADRRVSERAAFLAYLHGSLEAEDLTTGYIKRLFGLVEHPDDLRSELTALPQDQLSDVIGRLVDELPDYRPGSSVKSAVLVLLEFLPAGGDQLSSVLTRRMPLDWGIGQLVFGLVNKTEDPEARSRLVHELFMDAPTLSARLSILNWFGHWPGESGRKRTAFLAEADTVQLSEVLRGLMRETPTDELAAEPLLARLLEGLLYPDQADGQAWVQEKLRDRRLFFHLLGQMYGSIQSQPFGGATIKRERVLRWNGVSQLVGEPALRELVADARAELSSSELQGLPQDSRAAFAAACDIVDGRTEPNPNF